MTDLALADRLVIAAMVLLLAWVVWLDSWRR